MVLSEDIHVVGKIAERLVTLNNVCIGYRRCRIHLQASVDLVTFMSIEWRLIIFRCKTNPVTGVTPSICMFRLGCRRVNTFFLFSYFLGIKCRRRIMMMPSFSISTPPSLHPSSPLSLPFPLFLSQSCQAIFHLCHPIYS